MRTVLTIAGSDSSAGAGVQADLKTFAAHGLYGTCAITAITAQNTLGVVAVETLSADLVAAQIEAVAGDIELHAVKTGMLANAAIVEAVAAAIGELDLPNLVVDPVLASTSGARLLDQDGVQMMLSELLPRARVVTPNIPEAEALSGRRIASLADAQEAAKRIQGMGPSAVIVTGGHGSRSRSGRSARNAGDVVDVLFDGRELHLLRVARVRTAHAHGSGCTFASAVAANLARGSSLVHAARKAQQFVAGAIRHGLAIGHGHGPVDQFWKRR
jgi:hydroxymethylpyrimidine/phosphomethylpyrimidine kinase